MNDIVRRVFEFNDYEVNQVMNITDVDDKTIRQAEKESLSLKDLGRKYEELFFNDLQALNIKKPHVVLRATENIPEIISLISILLDKGAAYRANDGIYMSIEKVRNYGALARLPERTSTAQRINNDEYDKENAGDFALWKFYKESDNDAVWDAPFGKGRPGWHIECSAMAMKALGASFDIHTGGVDLIFPHHANEIAQSEEATGKTFVRYWIHGGMMDMNKEKMAKSKGNIIKLHDLTDNSISPLSFRYFLFSAHYRTTLNFTLEAVFGAQNALSKLVRSFMEWENGGEASQAYLEKFRSCINDDFDMPKSLSLSWELVKDKKMSGADKKATLLQFDKVYGLNLSNLADLEREMPEAPPEITVLAEEREKARDEKDFVKADALRKEIEERGFEINDKKGGFEIKKKSRN